MQEVFEKIIEKLEEEIEYDAFDYYKEEPLINMSFEKLEDIINQVAEEYNNGWISVEKAMPEEHDSLFAKFKNTDKWRSSMFEKNSDIVQVTVTDNHGNSKTNTAHTLDGIWSCDILRFNSSFRITHWQPLSEPYQPKGDKE